MTLENTHHSAIERSRKVALFDLGFRPFFLLAGISAVLLMCIWIFSHTQGHSNTNYYSTVLWHSHEMIFAYVVAVVAGFLLTAVRNWTGISTTHGAALASLVLVWVAGRIAPFFSAAIPPTIIAIIDIAFLPILTAMLSIPLIRKRQKNNLIFVLILIALSVANIMIHLQVLGITQETANHGIYFAVYLIVFLIMITGGRVIPFFTETAIKGATLSKWPAVEYFSLGGFVLLITLDMAGADPLIILIVATLVAIAHSLRLFGWYQRAVWSHPLLWVLYLAYFWLITGLLLKALAAAGLINPMLALHAFTTGTIGTMTLGMMVRVTLGHTGRELHPQITTILAFVLVNLAAMSRVFLPILFPAGYALWVVLAGLLWSTAFAIFVLSYSGFLIQARIDGKPG